MSVGNGANSPERRSQDGCHISVTLKEYQELIAIIDRALSRFGGRPPEETFDLEVYDELRRAREAIVRAGRDLRDPNVRRDSKSPLESS